MINKETGLKDFKESEDKNKTNLKYAKNSQLQTKYINKRIINKNPIKSDKIIERRNIIKKAKNIIEKTNKKIIHKQKSNDDKNNLKKINLLKAHISKKKSKQKNDKNIAPIKSNNNLIKIQENNIDNFKSEKNRDNGLKFKFNDNSKSSKHLSHLNSKHKKNK